MKFWQATAFTDAAQLIELAPVVEQVGFHGICVSDHLVFPQTIESEYPYTRSGRPYWKPDTDWPDPWVTIGAMASVTSTLRFTTNVFVLPARDPFSVAKTVSTAAVISEDRVLLGVGAGWMKEEFDLVGQPFDRRGARMEEMIDVLRLLWSGEMVEHHGEFYDFPPVQMAPAPAGPIPVLIGGQTGVALKRAARIGDGWVSSHNSIESLIEIVDRLHALRRELGTDDRPFTVLGAINDFPTIDNVKRLEDAGVDAIATSAWMMRPDEVSSVDDKRRALEQFAEAYIAPLG